MILSATLLRTGSFWSAMYTAPNPRCDLQPIQFNPLPVATALDGVATSGLVDEYPSHRFRGRSEEVAAVAPKRVALADESHVRLVDESSRLQRVTWSLAGHAPVCNLVKLVIHERKQLAQSLGVVQRLIGQQPRDCRSRLIFHNGDSTPGSPRTGRWGLQSALEGGSPSSQIAHPCRYFLYAIGHVIAVGADACAQVSVDG